MRRMLEEWEKNKTSAHSLHYQLPGGLATMAGRSHNPRRYELATKGGETISARSEFDLPPTTIMRTFLKFEKVAH